MKEVQDGNGDKEGEDNGKDEGDQEIPDAYVQVEPIEKLQKPMHEVEIGFRIL